MFLFSGTIIWEVRAGEQWVCLQLGACAGTSACVDVCVPALLGRMACLWVTSSPDRVLLNGVCLCVLLTSAVCHHALAFPLLLYHSMLPLNLSSVCVCVCVCERESLCVSTHLCLNGRCTLVVGAPPSRAGLVPPLGRPVSSGVEGGAPSHTSSSADALP